MSTEMRRFALQHLRDYSSDLQPTEILGSKGYINKKNQGVLEIPRKLVSIEENEPLLSSELPLIH